MASKGGARRWTACVALEASHPDINLDKLETNKNRKKGKGGAVGAAGVTQRALAGTTEIWVTRVSDRPRCLVPPLCVSLTQFPLFGVNPRGLSD